MDHVYLVGDDKSDLLHPGAPVTNHGIRLLGRGDYDVGILEVLVVGIQVAGAEMRFDAQFGELLEIVLLLRCQRLQRDDVKNLFPLPDHHVQCGYVTYERFTAGRGYGDNQVMSLEGYRYGLCLRRM